MLLLERHVTAEKSRKLFKHHKQFSIYLHYFGKLEISETYFSKPRQIKPNESHYDLHGRIPQEVSEKPKMLFWNFGWTNPLSSSWLSSTDHTQLQPYLSPAPRSSGDISRASGTFRRFDDAAKRWIVKMIETGRTCLCSRKNCQHKLRVEPNLGFTCHTVQEQFVFILNEAPVGVFQTALSKNNPVTLHSNWQPSGGQRDGVEGGGNTPPPTPPRHQPPKHASSCVHDMAWTTGWEGACDC